MNPYLRQKACIPCATSKRKCDRQLPECRRCLARDVDCSYPKSRRTQPYPMAAEFQDPRATNFAPEVALSDAPQSLDIESLAFPATGIFDASLYGLPGPDFDSWTESADTGPGLSQEASFIRNSAITVNNATQWFLREKSWDLQSVIKDASCVVDLEKELKTFIDAVYKLMRIWVTTGSNGFIHPRLYKDGMPSCLQDAFLVLSAYVGSTTAVEEVILEIAEQKSLALIAESQVTPDGASTKDVLHFLAKFQALFIHSFTRLHSGSVRRRNIAENHLPVLRQWLLRLNSMARNFQNDSTPMPGRKPIAADFDNEYDAFSDMWHLWILTESIRRTHLITECWMDAYEALAVGQAACSGTPMITARAGLWEAGSAMEWFEATCAQPSLLVGSLHPEPVMSRYEAEEVDDFVKASWQVIVGGERMMFWHKRSKHS